MFVFDDFFGFAGDIINGAEFDGNGNANNVFGNLPGLAESIKAIFGRRGCGLERVWVPEK